MHESPAWWSQGFSMMRIQAAAPARLNTQKAPRCETLWPLGPSCLCLLLSFLIIFISTLSCVMAVNSQYILTKHLFVSTVCISVPNQLCVYGLFCLVCGMVYSAWWLQWHWRVCIELGKLTVYSLCCWLVLMLYCLAWWRSTCLCQCA